MAKTNQNTTKANCKGFAIALLVVCIAAFLLPVNYLNSEFLLKQKMPIVLLFSLLGANEKIWGFIPTLINAKTVFGLASSLCMLAFFVGLIATITLAIVALVKKERANCLLKVAVFVFTWCTAIYCLCIFIISSYLNTVKITLDAATFIYAILGAAVYFYLLLKQSKASGWLLSAQFFILLLAAGAIFLGFTFNGSSVGSHIQKDKTLEYAIIIASGCMFAVLGVTTLLTLAHNIWTACMQLVITVSMLIIAICVSMLGYAIGMSSIYVPSLAAVVLCVGTILLNIFSFYIVKRNEDKALALAYGNEMQAEEYLEVTAYDPATLKKVTAVDENGAEAQAATEEELPDDPEKEALFEGKDDAFIATLSKAEKYEFADLYILKNKGNMKGIPAYDIGGDNSAFFKKIFIYLSQYRSKISAELLAKISDFVDQN